MQHITTVANNIIYDVRELNKAVDWLSHDARKEYHHPKQQVKWCCNDAVHLTALLHHMLRQHMQETSS